MVAGTEKSVGHSMSLTESFELFWQSYPKKKSRNATVEEWRKLDPSPQLVEIILEAVSMQKRSKQWLKERGQYIPEPKNWLKDKRWTDETKVNVCSNTSASYELSEIEKIVYRDGAQ